jgi:hypothetical protein
MGTPYYSSMPPTPASHLWWDWVGCEHAYSHVSGTRVSLANTHIRTHNPRATIPHGKQRVGLHAGKKKKAEKRKRRMTADSSEEDEEDEGEDDGEEEEEDDDDDEGEGEDGEEGEEGEEGKNEDVHTVKRILAKEERPNGRFYLVDWEGWALEEATWESIGNILTANDEVRQFEEVLAAMPRLGTFAVQSASGCCLGSLCCFPQPGGPVLAACASCGGMHHYLCTSEHTWLKWIGDLKADNSRFCFDCWLLAALVAGQALPQQVEIYYTTSSSSIGVAHRFPHSRSEHSLPHAR